MGCILSLRKSSQDSPTNRKQAKIKSSLDQSLESGNQFIHSKEEAEKQNEIQTKNRNTSILQTCSLKASKTRSLNNNSLHKKQSQKQIKRDNNDLEIRRSQLQIILGKFFLKSYHPSEINQWQRKLLKQFYEIMMQLAYETKTNKNAKKSIEYYEKCQNILSTLQLNKESEQWLQLYKEWAEAQSKIGRNRRAEEYFLKCVSAYQSNNDCQNPKYLEVLFSFGNVRYKQKQYVQALDLYLKCEYFLKQNKDLSNHYIILQKIGLSNNQLKQYQKAIECYNQCLLIQKQLGEQQSKECANTHANLGNAYFNLQQYQRAKTQYQITVQMYQRLKIEPEQKIKLKYCLGNTFLNINNFQKAAQCFQEVIAHFQNRNSEYYMAAVNHLAQCKKQMNKFDDYVDARIQLLRGQLRNITY